MKYFKQALLLALLCVMSLQANAQTTTNKVGVNTNGPAEILDVNGTMRVRDLPANNTANAIYNGSNTKTQSFIATHTVVADRRGVLGRAALPKQSLRWFYMPPMNLPVDTSDPSYSGGFFTVDLYAEYSRQFTNPMSSNSAAPSPKKYEANQLDYYVLYFDRTFFESVSLTDDGKLKYALKPNGVLSPNTFFTIVYGVR